MTTANKVTIFRILLIPVFVVEILNYVNTGSELHRVAGLVCFLAASVLDAVDGFIARHFDQRSELGTILDPLADKLLLVSAVVLLSFDHTPKLGALPLWLSGTIIGRDVVLLTGLVVIQHTMGRITVRPHAIGKLATVLQMISVVWLLLKWDADRDPRWFLGLALAAAVLTGVSGLIYVREGVQQLGQSPQGNAKPPSNHPE